MRVVKTLSIALNPEARCDDCDWEQSPSKTTLSEVRAHVKATEHKVVVTSRTCSRYEPKGV